jgi:hypothetical protein
MGLVQVAALGEALEVRYITLQIMPFFVTPQYNGALCGCAEVLRARTCLHAGVETKLCSSAADPLNGEVCRTCA